MALTAMAEEIKFINGIVSGEWVNQQYDGRVDAGYPRRAIRALQGYLKALPSRVKWDEEVNISELKTIAQKLLEEVKKK